MNEYETTKRENGTKVNKLGMIKKKNMREQMTIRTKGGRKNEGK